MINIFKEKKQSRNDSNNTIRTRSRPILEIVLSATRLPHKVFSKFKIGLFEKNNKVVKQDNIPYHIIFSKFHADLFKISEKK